MATPPEPQPPVLVAQASAAELQKCRAILIAGQIPVQMAASAADTLRLYDALRPKVVVLDVGLPDRDGRSLAAELLAIAPDLAIILTSSEDSAEAAVAALRAGAFDFLLKPFDEARLLTTIRAALAAGSKERGESTSQKPRRRRARDENGAIPSIGSSLAMQKVHHLIGSVARSIASVFITGESGTGKELAAMALHEQSNRAKEPFIALNCGAIPHELLESEVFGHLKGSFTGAIADNPGAALAADGGTLFLDEVCEMAPALQTKFLRFLQNSMVQPLGATKPRRVDVRIICATNRDPMQAVREGLFREDLFYRLHVVPLHLPPLRERGRDILEIAAVALQRYGAEEGKVFTGFTPETEAIMMRHSWPGNVRQLLNVMRNVAVLHHGGMVTPDMLPPSLSWSEGDDGRKTDKGRIHLSALPATQTSASAAAGGESADAFAGKTLAEIERAAIEAALLRHSGSVPRAARDLDISISTLYRRIEAWNLKAS